ncbi:glycosyltransferase [Vibrio alginolyticus]|uniref:glycosyltransferase n=1 Tax=Vibrio alginolyticus TaxID=663 RepID=UPI00211A9D13|nr:glycosyltransferase [Vibrio alginolyticus]MCQ9070321.1 glycosyltransferase [Vibrio alginolyticus]
MKVVYFLPHPNRHYYDVFRRIDGIDLQYVFLSEQPHYRRSVNWSVEGMDCKGWNGWKDVIDKVRSSDIVVCAGIVYPTNYMPFIFMIARLFSKRIIVATEEVSFKRINSKILKFLFRVVFDSSKVDCLSVGNRVSKSYKDLGISKWNFRKFGGFENRVVIERKSSESFRLLSVGCLNDNKNHMSILKALSKINTSKKIDFHLAGEGELREKLIEYGKNLPNNIRLIYHGYCDEDELNVLYSNTDVYIQPSIRDRWGVVVSQAIENALPVILSSGVRSGDGYLVAHGFNGFIYSEADQLSKYLERIMIEEEYNNLSVGAGVVKSVWGIENSSERLKDFLLDRHAKFESGPLSLG